MKDVYRSFPLLILGAAAQQANADAIANPDNFTVTQGNQDIALDVLQNDTPSTVHGRAAIYAFSAASTVGAVRLVDQMFYYTPPSDFIGTDSFTYYLYDDAGYIGSLGTVTINVVSDDLEPEIPRNFSSVAVGKTNKAIARIMDDLCTPSQQNDGEPTNNPDTTFNTTTLAISRESLTNTCGALFEATTETAQFNSLLREIAPDETLIQRDLLTENSRNKTSRLYRSIAQMRNGSNISVGINGSILPLGGAAGDSLGSPWTLLSTIQIENFDHDITENESGYNYDAFGLMLGLGYRLSGNVNIGAALDWTSYDVSYDGNAGKLDSDIYSLTSFLSWYKGAWSVDIQAGYTQGSTQAQRRFTLLEISAADSDYNSRQLDVSTQVDWSLQLGAWALRPFLRLDYLNTTIDAFNETGSASWLVAAEKQRHEQLNTNAGLNTSYTLSYSWGVMVPSIRLSLVSQSNLSNSPIAFQFIGVESSSGHFELRADSPDSLFYQWDISTAFALANGLSTFLNGQVLSGYNGISAYQISGGINWEF